jgi:phage repressor protein C with HTH and peptisase S24 domain
MKDNIKINSDPEVATNLREIRRQNKLGQKKMADMLEVSISAYQNYEKGSRPITKRVMSKLLELFDINPTWILTGVGEPTINQKGIYSMGGNSAYEFIPALDSINHKPPMIGGVLVSNSFVDSNSFNIDNLYCYSIHDNTMDPYIAPGEPILIDTAQNHITDGVFMLDMMGQHQIRRIQLRPDGIWITADNKTYDPIIISESHLNKINLIGKVFKINQILS